LFPILTVKKTMITSRQLEQALERRLEGSAHFVVTAEVRPGGKAVVEVDGEEAPITLAELSAINKGLREEFGEALDDVELQVGSPGVGRPFKVERQYRKHFGKLVEVLLTDGTQVEGVLESHGPQGLGVRILEAAKIKGRKPKLSEDITVIPFTAIKGTQATIKLN
jgi:ribosome maturation factor RimP